MIPSGLLFEFFKNPFQKQYANKIRTMRRIPPSTQETTTTASRDESLQLKPEYPNGHGLHLLFTALCPLGHAMQLLFDWRILMKPSLQKQVALPFVLLQVVDVLSQGNGSTSHKSVLLNVASLKNSLDPAASSIFI